MVLLRNLVKIRWRNFILTLIAATYGRTKCVKNLIKYGAKRDIQGITGLTALMNRRSEIVKILIKMGSDANIKDIYGKVPFIDGNHFPCLFLALFFY